jgi:hypothetical protein
LTTPKPAIYPGPTTGSRRRALSYLAIGWI